jgi:hypothetical protein
MKVLGGVKSASEAIVCCFYFNFTGKVTAAFGNLVVVWTGIIMRLPGYVCLKRYAHRHSLLSFNRGLKMKLWHRLAEQFCQPTGFLGRIVGFLFRMNREGIDWTIADKHGFSPRPNVRGPGFVRSLKIEEAS